MASGSRNEKFISTKKVLRTGKINSHGLTPTMRSSTDISNKTHNCIYKQLDNSYTDDRLPQSNYHKLDCSEDLLPSNQNFSSRNSLRTAQSVNVNNHNDVIRAEMSDLFDHEDVRFIPGREISDTSSYVFLTSDCFVRFIEEESKFFYCILCCKKGLATDDDVGRHLNLPSHSQRFFELQQAIYRQPFDKCSIQLISLNEKLKSWYNNHYLSHDDKFIRDNIVEEFREIVKHIDQSCECRLFGSYLTETALKSSDINLELIHPNSELFAKDPRAKNSIHHKLIDPSAKYGSQLNNHVVNYDLIPNAVDTLFKLLKIFSNPGCDLPNFKVISDYRDLNKKTPTLTFLHTATNILLKVSCYAEGNYRLSALLQTYLSLDQRARILSFLVRCWAKICQIDNPDRGTFPPEAYTILVIYFLQRTSPPILPCLHESLVKLGKLDDDILNKSNVNHPKHHVRTDESKLGARTGETPSEAVEADDAEDEDDGEFGTELTTEDLANYTWTIKNNAAIHSLFVNFISFMIDEFNDLVRVITIRTLKQVNVQSKAWNTQIKAIENPSKPQANMSRCIGTHRQFNYIYDCFKHCYFYLTSLPLICNPNPKPRTDKLSDPKDYTQLYINDKRFASYFRLKLPKLLEKVKSDTVTEMIRQNLFAKDVEVIDTLLHYVDSYKVDLNKLPGLIASSYNDGFLLPSDIEASLFCWICKKVGHTKSDCPRGRIENLAHEPEFYDFTLDEDANLDFCLTKVYERSRITPRIRRQHHLVVNKLTSIISDSLDLNCHLELFGSTVNNLGSIDSDLDICMTIKDNPTGENIDCVKILQKVSEKLVQIREIQSLESILTARVPILRFKYDIFDVDLSMFNTIAIHNSKLLLTYSLIDRRVAQIFYLVKRFAKECGIADASKCSLSSYAWALLVIHYLQHTNPPILPVLQEPNGESSMVGVNGWNVWFRTDIHSIKMQNNSESLTQLFKGFFLYYGNFDFDFHVISVRKFGPISRYQKNWQNCIMAIEDPFELTYNLATRLDEQMGIFIINSFSQAYRHIITIQRDYLAHNQLDQHELIRKIFNGLEITGTAPPYRGCHVCHRIGHSKKGCPMLQKRKAEQLRKSAPLPMQQRPSMRPRYPRPRYSQHELDHFESRKSKSQSNARNGN